NQQDNSSRSILAAQPSTPGTTTNAPAQTSRDLSDGHTPTWRLQSDLTRALGANTKLETGVLGIHRRTGNTFDASTLVDGDYVPNVARSNAFAYREDVQSLYGVLSQRAGAFELQGGLRLERATTRFDLATQAAPPATASAPSADAVGGTVARTYNSGYNSAFPSALVAYNLDLKRQVKISYSRRISRPDPQQLNPSPFREDALNVFQGNPALRPEYTDAYELGYQQSFAKGSFQLSPYFRRTPHAVRYIRLVDTSGVTLSTFDNVARNDSYGTDLNLSLRLGRFTAFGGGSAFREITDAHNVTPDVSFHAFGWTARGNGTFKLTPSLDLQAFAFYRAPMNTEGGRSLGFKMTTFALKQKLRGDNASLTLRAQDPFNTMAWGIRTIDGQIVQTTDRRFGARALSLSYNYTFGKAPKFRPRTDDTPQQAPAGGAGGGPPG
ncbi:MAG: outer membrane beta-barrel family protein, partial [Candidatus Eremiobacteraeota bacterium]|nr:outer membrane beta-barrel family protein [Candidatus Eremiobacteraeota bacterium]